MGAAFLPWEKWIAQLFHGLSIEIKRRLYKIKRRRALAKSQGWPEIDGSITAVIWDSSSPRDEILYSYNTQGNYYSGSHWRWFDLSDARELRVGDTVMLRYDEKEPEESILLKIY
jgi:hypothetical protein